MAAVTICSDFGAQKYKVSHCQQTTKAIHQWFSHPKAEIKYSDIYNIAFSSNEQIHYI